MFSHEAPGVTAARDAPFACAMLIGVAFPVSDSAIESPHLQYYIRNTCTSDDIALLFGSKTNPLSIMSAQLHQMLKHNCVRMPASLCGRFHDERILLPQLN